MSDEIDSETLMPEQVAVFEATQPLLLAMAAELKRFALKKPDATLSAQKVSFVNRLLVDLKALLANEPTIKYLDLLTDDGLPQYSDVVLILSQYEAAMRAFWSRYRKYSRVSHAQEWQIQTTDEEDPED